MQNIQLWCYSEAIIDISPNTDCMKIWTLPDNVRQSLMQKNTEKKAPADIIWQ